MNTTVPHPVNFVDLFFTELSMKAVPGLNPPEHENLAAPNNRITVSRLPEPGFYEAVMRTNIDPDESAKGPYRVAVECHVVLQADDTLDDATALRAVTITAHNVLYGAIREAVAWITGRGPYPALKLGISVLRPVDQAPTAGSSAAPDPAATKTVIKRQPAKAKPGKT